jgi:Ca-activated chloride channel family protein
MTAPKLHLRADRTLIRARGASVRYLLASITAPVAPKRSERLPVNIALILDRSGSMDGENKFPLAVEAVKQSLRLLTSTDRVSIVVFDERVDVILPSTFATAEAKKRALRELQQVRPRNSTDLCAGWMHGGAELSDHIADDTITRALLLTDGQANHGETNREVLAHHASELRRRGIVTSAFGVGADFDERLLRDIANEGGGNFYFVQTAAQIPNLVTSELGEALEVVVPGAELTLTLPRGAEARVLNRFRTRKSHGRTGISVELGDLVSAQELDVIVRVKFPLGEIHDVLRVAGSLGDDVTTSVEFTYAGHGENDDQARDTEVDREVARIYAGRARAEATEANRHGDFDRARRALVDTARHIDVYAGDDPELRSLADALRDEVPHYAEAVMAPMALKSAFFIAESTVKGRTFEGKARRG